MKLVISSRSPRLSRMLYLEAKRCALAENATDGTLFLLDLDHPDPAVPPPTGAVCVGFSEDPTAVDEAARAALVALLPLPFSVRAFDETLEALFPRVGTGLLIVGEDAVVLGGKRIRFSKTEAALFALLYGNRDRAVTAAEIATVLGDSAKDTNTAAVYLYRLRQKLCADGKQRIRTLRGTGAQWVGEEARSL